MPDLSGVLHGLPGLNYRDKEALEGHWSSALTSTPTTGLQLISIIKKIIINTLNNNKDLRRPNTVGTSLKDRRVNAGQ